MSDKTLDLDSGEESLTAKLMGGDPPTTPVDPAAPDDPAAPEEPGTTENTAEMQAAPHPARPVRAEARSPVARRGRWLLLVVLLAVAASGGGLAATVLIKSPAERAADTAPPPRTVLTEKVARRVLASTVVMRGQFANGRLVKFRPAAGSGSTMVVTGVYTRTGATVRAGKVVVEISGRPVFALTGAFPAYRDMQPGETGKDILQLQHALRRIGYGTGSDHDGTFGTGTSHAVKQLYDDLGYPVPQIDVPSAQPSATSTTTRTTTRQKQPMMPMSEVAFLPTLPARVVAFGASVGDTPASPLITFTTGGPRLTGKLDPASGPLVKAGMAVKVADEATGFTGTGKVTSVGAQASAGGADYLPLQIDGDKPWPPAEAGKDVRLTITAAATKGKALAVPEAALSADAGGNTTVVVDHAGVQRVVVVVVGVSADGWVEVSPAPGQKLAAGDEVVTGK